MANTLLYADSYNAGARARMAGYVPVIDGKSGKTAAAAASPPATADSAAAPEKSGFMSFLKGVFDTINPLQHIPVVGAIYRQITGDTLGPVARIAGDTLYGGPIGAVFGIADTALKESTGKDMGETAFAMLTPKKDTGTMVASAAQGVASAPQGTASVPQKVASAVPNTHQKITWDPPAADATQFAINTQQPVPRELIAAKMMDALDKYKALKTGNMQPTMSGVF